MNIYTCVICGKKTNGTYRGIPFCLEHYEDGTCAIWIEEHRDNLQKYIAKETRSNGRTPSTVTRALKGEGRWN